MKGRPRHRNQYVDFSDFTFYIDTEGHLTTKGRPRHQHQYVDFLDFTIYIDTEGHLTTMFQKDMNLYLYLPPTSAHTPSIFQGMKVMDEMNNFGEEDKCPEGEARPRHRHHYGDFLDFTIYIDTEGHLITTNVSEGSQPLSIPPSNIRPHPFNLSQDDIRDDKMVLGTEYEAGRFPPHGGTPLPMYAKTRTQQATAWKMI